MREDDMDEMLRKAAENYEVDSGKAADWNFVYKALHEADEPMPADKKRKRRFVFWWLLLIPLGWLAHTAYNKFVANNDNPVTAKTKETATNSQPSPEKDLSGNQATEKKIIKDDNSLLAKQPVAEHNSKIKSDNNKPGTGKPLPAERSAEAPLQTQAFEQITNFEATEQKDKNKPLTESPLISIQKDSLAGIKEDKTIQQDVIAKETKPPSKKENTHTHYFYSGLIAGGDISFVKYQKMQPLGYNVGLLVGYKFKKLSIESGLLFVKKNYYTDGKYFDKSNVPYFNNAEILTVDGYCRMFEIPLNIRYNIIEKNKHAFFATAGFSSYLMNKEFYNYDYIRDGEQHYSSRAYMHTTQDWFSVLNLSAGYELRTGSKSSLRIEPYFKAPLSGVGTGNLSISSAGINVGVTRKIP